MNGSSVGDHDADAESLAAAVGLLSCSCGTPRSGPVIPSAESDIPPVPPLPARFLGERDQNVHGDTEMGLGHPVTASGSRSDHNQYGMRWSKSDEENAVEDDGYDKNHSDEDEEDEDVFGRMED